MAVIEKAAADGRIAVEMAGTDKGKLTVKLQGAEGLTLQ